MLLRSSPFHQLASRNERSDWNDARVQFAHAEHVARDLDLRHAACFDLGVEREIVAARASQLPRASKSARAIAADLAREVLGTGVAPSVRDEAVFLAAWGLLHRVPRSPVS